MRRAETGRKSYKAGLVAEWGAALFLTLKGYRILALRYKTPHGEIDILARKGRMIVVAEVKLRGDVAGALHSIRPKSRKRIESAALHFFASRSEYAAFAVRFDVIAVGRGRILPFSICHLDNAWLAEA